METAGLPKDLQELTEYHGHLCFGVLLGYKACLYAVEVIGKSENMMVLTGKKNCGHDAVRYLLNCTEENGKLVCRDDEGQFWAFYNRDEEEGVRLTVNPHLASQLPKDKDQAMLRLLEMPGSLLFLAEPFQCGCA